MHATRRCAMRAGHITLITIDNQSKRNAMPRAMLAELAALWDRLDSFRRAAAS